MSLVSDMKAILDTDETAEDVWYDAEGEAPRQIKAFVVRPSALDEFSGGAGFTSIIREVEVVNDPTFGVSVPQVGKDRIHLKKDLCDAQNSIFRVTEILDQDKQAYRLRVTL